MMMVSSIHAHAKVGSREKNALSEIQELCRTRTGYFLPRVLMLNLPNYKNTIPNNAENDKLLYTN